MTWKCWLLAGCLLLCACAPRSKLPSGAVLLDEEVSLTRAPDASLDSATRELVAPDDAVLVAIVEEHGTDVALSLSTAGAHSSAPMTVENRLWGRSLEVATLEVDSGSRVQLKVAGAPDAVQPGKVHLRVQVFARDAEPAAEIAPRLRALRAWSAATREDPPADTARSSAPAALQTAIEALGADVALAAEARLVRARILQDRKIDLRAARAAAHDAASAFAKLPRPDAAGVARANYLEALALIDLMNDPRGSDPKPEEAMVAARDMLLRLTADASLDAPQRAAAHAALGRIAVHLMNAEMANAQFGQALSLYQDSGQVGAAREIRCQLAIVLVEQGNFAEGARAFAALLPELDRIADPEMRVTAHVAAARALIFSDRFDEGTDLLLKALPLTRRHHLLALEAAVLNGLGNNYQQRGDNLQASAFYNEALNLSRDSGDLDEYVTSLASAGRAARTNGDLPRALELHTEAVERASSPILRARSRFDLAMDYYQLENLPKAIEIMRAGLAVDLGDPGHNALSDGKLGLALLLIESEHVTARDFDEAARLVRETIATCERAHDEWRYMYALVVGAQVDARRGRTEPALNGFERVIAMGEQYRFRSPNNDVRSTLLLTEKMAFMGYLDIVLADVSRRGPGVVRAATPRELAGLQRLERARQQSFGGFRSSPDAQTTAKMDAILAQMADKSLRIAALVGDERAHADELRQLRIDMARLHTEIESAREAGATRAGSGAPGPGATTPWRALAPGEVQLSYALGKRNAFVLARSQAGTRVTVLGMPRKELETLLTRLADQEARKAPIDMENLLARISGVLLPPGLLPEGSRSLQIAAEGRVASVPFAALRSPTDGSRRLVETHDVAMVTSLLGGDDVRPSHVRPYRFVALASGWGTYRAAVLDPVPGLRAATKEIQVAAQFFSRQDPAAKIRLFTGADGNAITLRDIWASGADVVHFATHALADLRQPIASLLVLPATDASGKATYLTAGQVQAWRGDVELVFLSACESAIGPPQYASGMPGLQRAFLRAGARSVIATLTPIEDVLAQQFAADFYARYTAGVAAARALGETQRAWLVPQPGISEMEQARRRITALSHAFFGEIR